MNFMLGKTMRFTVLLAFCACGIAAEYPVKIVDGSLVLVSGLVDSEIIIDTGATDSIVSLDFAVRNSLTMVNERGSVSSYHGKSDGVKMYYGDLGLPGAPGLQKKWIVVDLNEMNVGGRKVVCVLGMDLLIKTKAVIDIGSCRLLLE